MKSQLSDSELGNERRTLIAERPSSLVFENESKNHEAEIAVDRLRPRRVFEWQRRDAVLVLATPDMIAKEGKPRCEAARVLEKIPNRHSFPVVPPPLADATPDGVIKRQATLVDATHGKRCRDDDFGERGQIKNRVRCRDRGSWIVQKSTERLTPEEFMARADFYGRSGERTRRDALDQDRSCTIDIEAGHKRKPNHRKKTPDPFFFFLVNERRAPDV
jgi:hypothetical protein